jgi:putative transposase
LREAQIVIESWRRHFNTIRPHASLGYKPLAVSITYARAFERYTGLA